MNEHLSLTQNPLDAPQGNRIGNAAPRIAEFEEVILLAVAGLANEAHGPAIRNRLEIAGRKTSVSALYTTLQRLEVKYLVTSLLGEATAHAGGRAKTYYSITARGFIGGIAALDQRAHPDTLQVVTLDKFAQFTLGTLACGGFILRGVNVGEFREGRHAGLTRHPLLWLCRKSR